MRILLNILLVLAALLSAAVLFLQGSVLPALASGLLLGLRILIAVLIQWLFLRVFRKKALRAIPVFVATLAVVWGFFLYLTAPSWLGATFKSFLSDYVSFLFGCGLVWAFSWLMARIVPRIKRARRAKIRKKQKSKKHPA